MHIVDVCVDVVRDNIFSASIYVVLFVSVNIETKLETKRMKQIKQ